MLIHINFNYLLMTNIQIIYKAVKALTYTFAKMSNFIKLFYPEADADENTGN